MPRLLLFLLLLAANLTALAQNCPKIVKDGAVLRVTEPLGGTYQWFKNGTPIAGATADTLAPAENADYSVEVYGTSASYNYTQTPVTVQVSGQTLDRLLQPVVGVTVSFNGLSTASDAQGRFSFPNQTVNKGRITLQYEKAGYFAAGQGLLAHQNGAMKTVVCLVDLGKPVSFKSAEGLTANTPNAKVVIPKNALVLNGQPYNDSVRFFMASFSPDDAVYGETMPGGDLFALNAQNQDVMLQSLGILNVEMRTPAGQKLELNPDSLATINFRVPKMYKTLAATQTQIPLWHYDETAQLWREEGMAVKQTNGRFEGKVGHFSWWNCDEPNAMAYIKGCISNSCTNQISPFTTVYFNEMSLITDSAGCFIAPIVALQSIQINVNGSKQTVFTPQDGDTLTINGVFNPGVSVVGYGELINQTGSFDLSAHIYSLTGGVPTNLTYSIDSINFQSSSQFIGISPLVTKMWVKEGDCIKTIPVYAQIRAQICQQAPDSILAQAPLHTSLPLALIAQAGGEIILKLKPNPNTPDFLDFIFYPQICPCLQELDLSNSILSGGQQLNFNDLPQLQTLNLSSCQISELPAEIGNQINLKTLELHHNYLTTLPAEFGLLTALESLDLRYNQLVTVVPEIGNLTNLQTLNLNFNQITALPAEIGELSAIKSLSVTNNALSALPQEIGGMVSLETFYLDANLLNELPFEIGNLPEIKILSLSNNELTMIPSSIGNLTTLQNLDVSNNLLNSLPVEIGNLNGLIFIYLSANQLTDLPVEIGNWSMVTTIEANDCQLSSLPNTIGNLSNLQVLRLKNNQLSQLPPEICDLKNVLIFLELGNNPGNVAMQAQWDACP